MKKYAAILLISLITPIAGARIIEEYMPEILLESSVKDPALNKNEAVYTFVFRNIQVNQLHQVISYSIDGRSDQERLLNDQKLNVETTPGKHVFQFFFSEDYYEIYSDSLEIFPGYRNEYSVFFESAITPVMTEKPVIYCYPVTETEIDFKINIKGTDQFTYPPYNDGWKFTATPEGKLHFGENTYNYLFWDAAQVSGLRNAKSNKGFIVEGNEITSFLKDKLSSAGLNSKEQADFITYWGPRMKQEDLVFVRFFFNEECDKFAEFDINPKPDNVYRIYMVWHTVSDDINIEPQEIPTIDRTGFHVLEWGGQEIKVSKITPAKINAIKQLEK